MKRKNQNKRKLHQLYTINKNNPVVAKRQYEEYIEANPNHYSVYVYYSSLLITLGEFELADQILNCAQELYTSSCKSNGRVNLNKKIDDIIFENRIRILSYQGKYRELYELCLENYKTRKEMKDFFNKIIFYCQKQLGLLDCEKRQNYFYIYRQILEYDENDFFSHVKKHLYVYNENAANPNSCVFVKDFPFHEVLSEAKKKMDVEKRLFDGVYVDTYIFKYNLCGNYEGEIVDYFKITCFHDTFDIITMCPAMYFDESPFVDLNYLRNKHGRPKTKVLSQIDKFNQKYRITAK